MENKRDGLGKFMVEFPGNPKNVVARLTESEWQLIQVARNFGANQIEDEYIKQLELSWVKYNATEDGCRRVIEILEAFCSDLGFPKVCAELRKYYED